MSFSFTAPSVRTPMLVAGDFGEAFADGEDLDLALLRDAQFAGLQLGDERLVLREDAHVAFRAGQLRRTRRRLRRSWRRA